MAIILLFRLLLIARKLVKYFTYEFAALRKAALNELAGLQNQILLSDHRFAERVSALLKRVAIVRYAEQQPTLLNGDAWLAFLDQTNPTQSFSQAGGAVIGHAQYQNQAKVNRSQLIDAAQAWIKSI